MSRRGSGPVAATATSGGRHPGVPRAHERIIGIYAEKALWAHISISFYIPTYPYVIYGYIPTYLPILQQSTCMLTLRSLLGRCWRIADLE